MPRMKVGPRSWSRRTPVLPMVHPGHVRYLHRGPLWREPFTQMEEFMRDMERKFKRDVEDTMGSFLRTVSINTNSLYMFVLN